MSFGPRNVLVEHMVLSRIKAIAEAAAFRHEVGGILLGSYRGRDLHVIDASAPQNSDRWSPTRFWRSPAGHQAFADAAWRRSGGLVTHIGEWHSHPELRPTPSVIDRASWLKSRREQRRPLAFLIVGTADVCVCADAELGTIRALVPIDQDEMGVLFGASPERSIATCDRKLMTKARLDVPEDWISRTLDHAVQRYANRTGELFYFSMKGHHEAVRHAYEDLGGEGQWWIPTLSNNLLKAIALTLNGQWQNDVVEWLCETQAFGSSGATDFSKFRKSASPEAVDKHVRRLRGCGLSTFPEYATLRELHLVANAVRHGPGRSLTELWEAHPELWAPDSEIIRLRPWYMPAKEPLSQFIVSEADMNRYNDAVCTFWNRVAEAALTEGEGSD